MKQKQLWLYSKASGRGKSTLLLQLSQMLRLYLVSAGDWDNKWCDGDFDLAGADEYRAHKPITWINSFSEGMPMELNRKGLTESTKNQRIPFIIFSNQSIWEAYGAQDSKYKYRPSDVALIEVRFLEICVPDDGDIRIDFEGIDVNKI